MARSGESEFSTALIKKLNKHPVANFRKISDRYQVNIPDIIGCFMGRHISIESKVENVVSPKKKIPTGHPFTAGQVKELKENLRCGGGAYGAIACGYNVWIFDPNTIDEKGKVTIDQAICSFDMRDIRPLFKLMEDELSQRKI